MSGSSSSTCLSRSTPLTRSVPSTKFVGLLRVQHQVAAHAGGGVDDDVDVAGADPLHRLAVERDLAGALPVSRIAHVDVDDRGAGPRCRDARVGDLLGRHGHVLGPAHGVACAGQGAGDHDLAIHDSSHGVCLLVRFGGAQVGSPCEHAVLSCEHKLVQDRPSSSPGGSMAASAGVVSPSTGRCSCSRRRRLLRRAVARRGLHRGAARRDLRPQPGDGLADPAHARGARRRLVQPGDRPVVGRRRRGRPRRSRPAPTTSSPWRGRGWSGSACRPARRPPSRCGATAR